jgi:hypothetical protein
VPPEPSQATALHVPRKTRMGKVLPVPEVVSIIATVQLPAATLPVQIMIWQPVLPEEPVQARGTFPLPPAALVTIVPEPVSANVMLLASLPGAASIEKLKKPREFAKLPVPPVTDAFPAICSTVGTAAGAIAVSVPFANVKIKERLTEVSSPPPVMLTVALPKGESVPVALRESPLISPVPVPLKARVTAVAD